MKPRIYCSNCLHACRPVNHGTGYVGCMKLTALAGRDRESEEIPEEAMWGYVRIGVYPDEEPSVLSLPENYMWAVMVPKKTGCAFFDMRKKPTHANDGKHLPHPPSPLRKNGGGMRRHLLLVKGGLERCSDRKPRC